MNNLRCETLETERLILRKFQISDANDMFKNWANDPAVNKFLSWPAHQSVEDSKRIIASWVEAYEDLKNYNWCIELKSSHEAIGSIGVVNFQENIEAAEIGYCIGKNFWHKGITSEAFSSVIKFLFEDVHLNRICAKHDVVNENSGKVMKKCGLKHEGTLLYGGKNNTGICTLALYGIINPRNK